MTLRRLAPQNHKNVVGKGVVAESYDANPDCVDVILEEVTNIGLALRMTQDMRNSMSVHGYVQIHSL